MTQNDVTQAGGPSPATVRYVEGCRYEQLTTKTTRALEQALGWVAGSIQDVLLGGEPTIRENASQDAGLHSALEDLREQIAAVDRMLSERDPVDNPVVSMRIDPVVWEQAKKTAALEKRTVNDVIHDALRLYGEVMGDSE